MTLADLVVGGVSLGEVEDLERDRAVTVDVANDYRQLWRLSAGRVSDLCIEWASRPLRPAVVEPLAASTLAEVLGRIARTSS